ncbi:hypothetical protein DB32_003859 [Sandaracinus amylolyticus]|uniref:Uncharacterized protein n=1 Tax=Sandaracinus amylolyticus TaxID=927083 RepID=A0A0F6YII2_9BACT|nr:hypothetical protein DB32_003859 [Sandaracinus amylolyticus]
MFPVPIIATLLTLFSRRGRANGAAFAASWIVGIGLLTTVAALVADGAASASEDATSAAVSWVKLLVGVALLGAALRKWRARPGPGETAEMPKWMASVDEYSPRNAVRAGLLLSAANPKNWALAGAAGSTIGQVEMSASETAVCVAVFTGLASLSVAGPVLYRLGGGERAERALGQAQSWLVQNNAAILTVVLLIFGVQLVGKGLAGLSV